MLDCTSFSTVIVDCHEIYIPAVSTSLRGVSSSLGERYLCQLPFTMSRNKKKNRNVGNVLTRTLSALTCKQAPRGGPRRNAGGHSDERQPKRDVERHNERYRKYYDGLDLVPEEEREAFWAYMKKDLPNSFRFTGSKA